MSLGLVGRKVGMTRIFTDDGATVPVTVLDVSNNRVTQIKTPETDGYAAVQVTFGQRRASRVRGSRLPAIWRKRCRSRSCPQGVPGVCRGTVQPEAGRPDQRHHLCRRPEGRCHRYVDR